MYNNFYVVLYVLNLSRKNQVTQKNEITENKFVKNKGQRLIFDFQRFVFSFLWEIVHRFLTRFKRRTPKNAERCYFSHMEITQKALSLIFRLFAFLMFPNSKRFSYLAFFSVKGA